MNKRILIVSYSFPFGTEPEAIQTGRLIKFLDQSGLYKIDIVTRAVNSKNNSNDLGQLFNFSDHVNIYYTNEPEDRKAFVRLKSKSVSLYPFNQWIVDNCEWWIDYAIRTCTELIERNHYDCLYTRSFPASSNVVGLKIKKRYQIPWIAHFSDLWQGSPFICDLGILPSKNKKLEREIFKCSDLVTSPSELIAEFYNNKYHTEKTKLLEHICDSDIVNYAGKANADNGKTVIAHIGSFYRKRRTPDKFIDILRQIRIQYGADAIAPFHIQLIGNHRKEYVDRLEKLDLPQGVYSVRRVGLLESLRYMEKADILLFIDTCFAESNKNVFLPSKLMDYMVFQKPIICIADSYSMGYRILENEDADGCIVIDHKMDNHVAAEKLNEWLKKITAGETSRIVNYHTSRFNGESIVKQFISYIEEAACGSNE